MQFLNGTKCNQESDMNTKLSQLESNLNKLASEQEQVQASMKMIDSLQKLGAEFQQLQKRQEEYENYQIKPKHNNNQQQLSATIKQLESRMIDIDNLLLNCKTLHRRPDILNLELSFKNSLQTVKQEVQQEYKNIYKEMNGLKCDLDYVINGSVKARITNKIKTQNINLDSNKLLFINLLELETFIEELDRYESDNTERLLLEIKNADQDKLKSLNYQLAGTKRKYLNEIKKIEHKFRILSDIITPSSPQEKYTIQLSCQMNAIVSRLHKNIDTLLLTISEYQLQ